MSHIYNTYPILNFYHKKILYNEMLSFVAHIALHFQKLPFDNIIQMANEQLDPLLYCSNQLCIGIINQTNTKRQCSRNAKIEFGNLCGLHHHKQLKDGIISTVLNTRGRWHFDITTSSKIFKPVENYVINKLTTRKFIKKIKRKSSNTRGLVAKGVEISIALGLLPKLGLKQIVTEANELLGLFSREETLPEQILVIMELLGI